MLALAWIVIVALLVVVIVAQGWFAGLLCVSFLSAGVVFGQAAVRA